MSNLRSSESNEGMRKQTNQYERMTIESKSPQKSGGPTNREPSRRGAEEFDTQQTDRRLQKYVSNEQLIDECIL